MGTLAEFSTADSTADGRVPNGELMGAGGESMGAGGESMGVGGDSMGAGGDSMGVGGDSMGAGGESIGTGGEAGDSAIISGLIASNGDYAAIACKFESIEAIGEPANSADSAIPGDSAWRLCPGIISGAWPQADLMSNSARKTRWVAPPVFPGWPPHDDGMPFILQHSVEGCDSRRW
jgi:hypothetical protein